MRKLLACGLFVAVLCGAFATESSAQALYGALTGNVTDTSGAAIPLNRIRVSDSIVASLPLPSSWSGAGSEGPIADPNTVIISPGATPPPT